MKNKKTLLIVSIALVLIISTLIFFASAQTQAEKNVIKWQQMQNSITYDDLEDVNPTYTNIVTTSYYTPFLDDFESWCSPLKPDCFQNSEQIKDYYKSNNVTNCIDVRNAGWCCIPEKDRGFYEEVKCQGSGVANNQVYSYATIKPTLKDSPSIIGDYTNGRTAKGTDATPKRTVAVNRKAGTNCFIPDWQLMYIYWGEKNEWNGVYMAEDTGSAFAGACKIDVYVGVGLDSLNQHKASVNQGPPHIYLLDDEGNVISQNQVFNKASTASKTSTILGTYFTKYSHSLTIKNYDLLYNSVKKFVKDITAACIGKDKACIDNFMTNYNSNLNLTLNCLEDELYKGNLSKLNHSSVSESFGGFISQVAELIIAPDNKETIITIENTVTLTLTGDAFISKDSIILGSYIMVEDAVSNGKDAFIQNNPSLIEINPDAAKMQGLKELVVNLSNCATSDLNCSCISKNNWNIDTLSFTKNSISFDDFTKGNYIETTFDFNLVGEGFSADTKELDEFIFEKIDDEIIYSPFGSNLPECIPKERTYLFCANLKNSDLPPLKFALKI